MIRNEIEDSSNVCSTESSTSLYQCCCKECHCMRESESMRVPDETLKPYLRDEVVLHNKPNDFWVILHGKVLDLTIFFKTRQDSITTSLKLLLQYGGKDISHFFHPNGSPITRISAKGNTIPIFPPVLEKSGSDYFANRQLSWWQDPAFIIGGVTKQPRKVRIINTLTTTTQKMTVCEEDTIQEIQEKYYRYNWNQQNYHWRKYDAECEVYQELCLKKTLTENGFLLHEYSEPHTPSLWLFYKDMQ